MTDEIGQLIQAFLAWPRHSTGGWSPVEPQDMRQLDDIVHALVAAKWEADPDGDYPVDHILVDRTRYEPNHFISTRYLHKMHTKKERLYYIRDCMTNVLIAQDRLNIALKLWMLEQAERNDGCPTEAKPSK